jgi:hypothetical protein
LRWLHRDDGPAVIYPDGTQEWYKRGELLSHLDNANRDVT